MSDTHVTLHVLQLSDLHLLPAHDQRLLGVDTSATFEAVLRAARDSGPVDAIVVTGDVAHEPGAPTYGRASAAIERYFDAPTLWLPGNHDEAEAMASCLPRRGELSLGDWLLLGIDTHVDGAEGGRVSDAELRRIETVLTRSRSRWVMAFGHHPCVEVGTPWLDGGRVVNSAALLERLGADPRVRGYTFGHIHHAAVYAGAPWPLWSAPSTCFAFAQGGAKFAVAPGAPGCRRFALDAGGGVTSSVVLARESVVAPDVALFS